MRLKKKGLSIPYSVARAADVARHQRDTLVGGAEHPIEPATADLLDKSGIKPAEGGDLCAGTIIAGVDKIRGLPPALGRELPETEHVRPIMNSMNAFLTSVFTFRHLVFPKLYSVYNTSAASDNCGNKFIRPFGNKEAANGRTVCRLRGLPKAFLQRPFPPACEPRD